MADTETQLATNGILNNVAEDVEDAETKVKKLFLGLCCFLFDTSFLGNLAHEAKSR